MPAAPDLEVLRTFVAVAEFASFTRAAAQLNRTQSTVSLHVRRVEDVYGCSVFDRNSRSVRLTVEGERLLAFVRRMLDLHASALTQLRGESVRGSVRVGIPEDFATRRLPRVLRQFSTSHPGARVEVRTAVSADLFRALGDGDLDLVVARRAGGKDDSVVLWREPLVWAAPCEVALETARPLPLVMFSHGCLYRPLVIERLEVANIPWFVACTSTSLSGVQAAVAADLGVTVLAASTVADLRRCDDESALPALPPTEIALYRRRGAPAEVTEALCAVIRESFTQPLLAAA